MKNNFKDNMEYMSCHNHSEDSNFRLRDSVIKAEDIVNYAIEIGYSGVAITDHETISSHIRILKRFKYLKKLKGMFSDPLLKLTEDEKEEIEKEKKLLKKMPDNFKLCLGNEIYLIDNLEDVKDNYESGVTKYYHFILLAKNEKGYEQIRQISSFSAWKNWFRQKGVERVPTVKSELVEIIGENKGNLIGSTACLGGEFAQHVYKYALGDVDAKRKIHSFVTWAIDVFGKDNFYIELQPTSEEPEKDFLTSHAQIIVNTTALKIAKAYGLKWIVTTDSHYLKKEHRNSVHEAYLHADEGNSSNRELADFYATTYMMDNLELFDLLSSHIETEDIIKAFENTMIIHSQIEEFELQHDVIVPRDKNLPAFKVKGIFRDYYNNCPYIQKFAESEDVQERYFLFKCEEGFLNKKQELNETNVNRINIEMEEIWEASDRINMRIAPYYILVEILVNKIMWNISYVGIARGSVTGFYTAYLMDITQMNPLQYGLPHWRHLSKERPELPDIDLDSEASKRHEIFDAMKEYYGFDNVLNILTLKTEGSKSTCLTMCRGLDIDIDTAQAIADLIPFERGSNWSIPDCLYGNKKMNRAPVKQFIEEIKKYDGLEEAMLLVENLVCGRSIHASGVYVFENGFLPQNSRMRAPNGSFITAWTMKDSDYAGGLKIDCLTIKALDKLHTTVDLLIEYNVIEAEPTLKETYNKYLHPDILEYDDEEMWDMVGENTLIDAFQFDTEVGSDAAKKVKPKSLPELAIANSLMRLMGDGGEQPLDDYIRFKNNIELWYDELNMWALTEAEIKIAERHLLEVSGVADTQEVVMKIVMDKEISNFSIPEANKLRKAIAKKEPKILEQIKKLFYEKATEINPNSKLPQYIWEVQIKRQLGYSFSQNHTFPYSGICIQEMNLAHKYGKLFWNTACLTVNAGASEDNDNNKNTNYGKIAKAIGEIKNRGQKMALPDINTAHFSFAPNLETKEIIFGLKGICGVGDDVAQAVIDNRPYLNLFDFYQKITAFKEKDVESKFGDSAVVTLIKSGAFDRIENKSREEIMSDFAKMISEPLKKLTLTHITLLDNLNILTQSQREYELRLFKFKNYIFDKKFFRRQDGKTDTTAFYTLEENHALPFFYEHFETNMVEEKDYEYLDGEVIVKKGSLIREMKKLLNDFENSVLKNPNILEEVNKHRHLEKLEEIGKGTVSKWEMDSLSFYYNEHELENIDRDLYMVVNFKDLPEIPKVAETYMRGEREMKRFALQRICGTVLDTDKNKDTITLLTPDSGVVTIKYYKGQFGFYNKQISHIFEGESKKTVLEKSWFKRGNKLLITGYRRNDRFYPAKYANSAYNHTTQLIKEINNDGTLRLQSERVNVDEL